MLVINQRSSQTNQQRQQTYQLTWQFDTSPLSIQRPDDSSSNDAYDYTAISQVSVVMLSTCRLRQRGSVPDDMSSVSPKQGLSGRNKTLRPRISIHVQDSRSVSSRT